MCKKWMKNVRTQEDKILMKWGWGYSIGEGETENPYPFPLSRILGFILRINFNIFYNLFEINDF